MHYVNEDEKENVIFVRKFPEEFFKNLLSKKIRDSFPEDGIFHDWVKIKGRPKLGIIEAKNGEFLLLHYELLRFSDRKNVSDLLKKEKS